MEPPPLNYLERDGAALAYQVVGDGPADVVCLWEQGHHPELAWTDPSIHEFLERGATYSRAVYFQRRGIGLSEPVGYIPTVEQQADDALAIMDEIGMTSAILMGTLGTCAAAVLVAARHPERVRGLVLVQPILHGGADLDAEALADQGWTAASYEAFVSGYRSVAENWGSGESVAMWDRSLDNAYNRRTMRLLERCTTRPAVARAYVEAVLRTDVLDVLPMVRVPTRLLHVPNNPMPPDAVAYQAGLIAGATWHAVPPARRGASIGEAWVPIADHIEEMATGAPHPVDVDRFLGTVVFTDVVGSTEILATLGDARYRVLRDDYERMVRAEVDQAEGRLIGVSGDGTVSLFDGPSRAVHCAEAVCRGARDLGFEVRAGVHTGEIERRGPDITGMTVHIGARVGAAAGPGEVLVSRTVQDLVFGSDLVFSPRGKFELRGVPGVWELAALAGDRAPASALLQERAAPRRLDRATMQVVRRSPAAVRAAVRLSHALHRQRVRSAWTTG